MRLLRRLDDVCAETTDDIHGDGFAFPVDLNCAFEAGAGDNGLACWTFNVVNSGWGVSIAGGFGFSKYYLDALSDLFCVVTCFEVELVGAESVGPEYECL